MYMGGVKGRESERAREQESKRGCGERIKHKGILEEQDLDKENTSVRLTTTGAAASGHTWTPVADRCRETGEFRSQLRKHKVLS